MPAPNNMNTIKVYPNLASDHITIDNGNFAAMAGYSIKITNNADQQVFENPNNQEPFYIDLSSWSGNGLYFVHLIDSQNNTVTYCSKLKRSAGFKNPTERSIRIQ